MRFLMEQNAKTAHARPVVVAYPQVSRAFNKQCKISAIIKIIQMYKSIRCSCGKEMQTAIDQSLNK